MTERADFRELFAKAKRDGDIVQVASGLKLFRAGRRLRGECPSCGASKGKKTGGAFWVDPQSKTFGCFAECGFKGDVIDLEAHLSRISVLEAAERLAGQKLEPRSERAIEPARAPAVVSRPPRADDKPKKQRWADKVLSEAVPILGTPAQAYLENRGIRREALWWDVFASRRLLFHPAVPHSWDQTAQRWITWPAMIIRQQTPSGFIDGLHVTYLARYRSRGWAKAPADPPKRMWGEQKDALGRHAGGWLIGPEGNEPLIVAEGAESALSAAILYGKPCRVLATLALGRLQGGWKLDRFGRLNPDVVEADPETPALTWPFVDEVVIAIDHDMKPIKVKCRKATGGTYQRELTATDRARICGGLARQAWRRAGANRVRVIAAGAGRDFNDELQASVGRS